jgi:hypothetical protein
MYPPTTIAACILVGACAGTVKEGMAKLEGQPLSAVVARIAQPMGESQHCRELLGHTPTVLSERQRTAMPIQATMNGDVIERLAYEGDEALCQKYAERLRP